MEEKHRKDFMKVLMKMVYGKYCIHAKRNETARRAAIFRFLNGCLSEELDAFLGLLFAPLLPLIGETFHNLHTVKQFHLATFLISFLADSAVAFCKFVFFFCFGIEIVYS